jgi:hypothetical protein
LNEQAKRNRLDARLDANLHPVTRVYCDGNGFIVYERHNADPVPVDPDTPHVSRKAALRRCHETTRAIRHQMEKAPAFEARIMYQRPISATGIGLSYQEYYEQTYQAVQRSREVEAALAERARMQRGIGI